VRKKQSAQQRTLLLIKEGEQFILHAIALVQFHTQPVRTDKSELAAHKKSKKQSQHKGNKQDTEIHVPLFYIS
jgi:hypothetical protein